MLEVGKNFPEFELKDGEGESFKSDELLGQVSVLYFYPEDFTGGCTVEACEFRDLGEEFKKTGVLIVGISPDLADSHEKFAKEYGLKFRLLSDESHKLMDEIGVWGEKSLYGRKSIGVIRTTFVLDEKGKVVKVFGNVKANGHAERVLRWIKDWRK